MWSRTNQIFRFSVNTIFQHPNPLTRIEALRQLDLSSVEEVPSMVKLPFLREAKAKEILEEVSKLNIPNNVRIVHSLCHIEFNAFMSYADTLLRFKNETANLQAEFQQDMKALALEEGKHFTQLSQRLTQLGTSYGNLSVIPKLTLAIEQTTGNLLDRIAVISLVHQGRGVKAVQKLLSQLSKAGDYQSVDIVKVIQQDQKKHFAMGWNWFIKTCQLKKLDPESVLAEMNTKYKSDLKMPQ